MDREGFRNRLKQYKQAREENPGLKYWEWKDIPKYDDGTDGVRDNTYVAPIEKEQVFIPATGSTKLKQDIRNKITRNGQIKSGAIDIVSPEFDLLTGVRAIATLPSKAEKLGRVLSNSDIAAPQISIQPNNVIYQSPIKEKVKTISYGKAKTLASDFVTGSPYENIMGKVVSVDRGPWKSKIGVNSDQFGKYIGNGSESTVFMANDDPNFVYKILTTNVSTPQDAKDYLSVIYSNRNKVPAALQHKLIGFVKNGKGFNPVMRQKRVSVLDQKDNKTLLEKALPQIDKKMNRSGYNRYADTQYFNDKNNIDILDIKPENVGQLENGNYTLLDFIYQQRAEQIPIKSIASDIFSKWGKSYADGGEVIGPPTYEQWDADMNQYNPTILDNASMYWSIEAAKKALHNEAMKLPGYAERWTEYYRSLPKNDPDINEFVDELWANENPNNVGLKNGKYYPHKSPEGGKMTIGPGFKLDSGSHGISTKTANRGMTKTRLDQEARKIGKQHLKAVDQFINYGQTTNPADTVSPQIKMGLMDLRHQVGPLNEWSNLRQAVLNGDLEGIRKESTVTWNDNGKTKVDKRRKKIRDEKYFYYE